MRLPKDILSGNYTKPRIFLCETNKERICKLEPFNTSGSFKFNSYSELSFEVARVYNDVINGGTKVNPFFDKIESPRLVLIEGFGYFELQDPEHSSDGIKESKVMQAYSLEYTLSTKFLEDFNINTGMIDSLEVLNAKDPNHIVPIVLYNPSNPKLSLLNLALEKVYGWKIGHVDESLRTLSRQFEIDRTSVYDFLMNDVCEKFNCYIVFDTFENTINVYAESLTSKFIGDGETNTFIVNPPFAQIGTVSIDGYKTTQWSYDQTTGALTLESTPIAGAHIEIIDGALTEWETDVFITFDNLAQELKINYPSDEIKTVLTVTYGDDLDIREANMGLPYITDLSYFYAVDWMGQDLYDAYTAYLQKTNSHQAEYTANSQKMLEIANCIDFAENRLSLEYSVASSVNETTVGTYYVKGGTKPNYYYTEVSLPADYNVNTVYYSTETTNLQDGSDGNVSALYTALKNYFYGYFNDQLDKMEEAIEEINGLADRFAFMEKYSIRYLAEGVSFPGSKEEKTVVINNFLSEMWEQIGRVPLKMLYYEPYKKVQITNIEAGWAKDENENYGYYYTVVLLLESIEAAITKRDKIIEDHETQYSTLQNENYNISNELLMSNNFTEGQLVRLSAFLREDELHLDDIVETDLTTVAESFKLKQDAMESGRIELNRLCQPQLQFSMSMANIYALPEFEPIIDQFQLGNVIKVGLRSDYIKQSRLLQVDLNFDDLSDFSCEFGDLTSLRSQSDIHADLLKKAVQAGKSVATNSSYWSKGSDKANSIDLRLQEGLLNSIEALKAIDGTQNAFMDKWGIHLEVINPDTGEIDDKRVWMVNNQIAFTDDGFKTIKTVLGEFTVDGITYYGLLAQAVIAGLVEGSQIIGGTIKIGLQEDGTYAFEVHEDGSVTMNGGSTIAGYATEDDVNQLKSTTPIISDLEPTEAKNGQLWLNTSTTPYSLMVYNNGEWVYFDQSEGIKVHTSEPSQYSAGDLWILADGESYTDNSGNEYGPGSILKADENLNWINAISDITTTIANVKESFKWDDDGIKVMKRVADSDGNITNPFYVHIDSTRMGFHSVEYNNGAEINDVEVVHIGNNSAVVQNATFEGDNGATFDTNATFNKKIHINGEDTSGGTVQFTWQIESNGSFSLVI